MRKLLFILLFLSIIIFSLESYASAEKHSNINSPTSNELLLEESFIRAMGPEISRAIKDYYGEGKLFYLSKITNIKKDKNADIFEVTVQVVSYEKAIMPPYGLETITFRIPGYKVINFKHKDIKEEELPKDKFDN
ncbi:DUF3888 domain-containing protein [Priestia megaterium]|jgi:Protein of unknown function (DUF3888)|uniref:DUF3888 domain-containing protein n=1 Tax=Priestia megaterium TaxID=1404 RepID=UPI0023DBB784|nr:DUF3888 domain-containing protein [Priestia megaterium]MDF2014667.1 DUF3888 domain-containing protein [Priestia megaterium]